MKKESIFVYAVIGAMFCCLFVREAMFQIEQQNIRFAEATRIVKRECLSKMYEAEQEGNINKVIYYKNRYNSAEVIVRDFGIDYVLVKKNSH